VQFFDIPRNRGLRAFYPCLGKFNNQLVLRFYISGRDDPQHCALALFFHLTVHSFPDPTTVGPAFHFNQPR
jgi:hypothetical protein